LISQQSFEFLWGMMLNKGGARCATLNGETMAGVLGVCIAVCGSNERDDELLDSVEQLLAKSVLIDQGWRRQ
jgi:hypothetical protein